MSQVAHKVAKGELVFTSFLFFVAVVILVDTSLLQEADVYAVVGPKTFPFVVGGLLLVLSSIQIVSVLRGHAGTPDGQEPGEETPKFAWKPLVMVAGAVLLHILILLPFGFLPAGIVLFWLVAVAMGEKRIWRAGAIAVAITVITYVGFVFGLQLPLPIGSVFESLGVSIG